MTVFWYACENASNDFSRANGTVKSKRPAVGVSPCLTHVTCNMYMYEGRRVSLLARLHTHTNIVERAHANQAAQNLGPRGRTLYSSCGLLAKDSLQTAKLRLNEYTQKKLDRLSL